MLPLRWRRGPFVSAPTRARPIPGFRLALEPLEAREVPAAALVSAADPSFMSPSASSNGQSETTPVHSLSADGRYLVYISTGYNLVPNQTRSGGTTTTENVYLYDTSTGATTLVSHDYSAAAENGNADSFDPVISADGSTVAFFSAATDLISGGGVGGGTVQLYLYDVPSGALTLVTHTAAGSGVGGNATNPFIPSTPANSYNAVNTLGYYAGVAAVGIPGGGEGLPSLSADGNYVAFIGNATDLGFAMPSGSPLGDTPTEVFLYDRTQNTLTLVSHEAGTTATDLSTGASSSQGDGYASTVSISGDGSTVAFTAPFDDLIAGAAVDGVNDQLYVWSRVADAATGLAAGQTVLASHQAGHPTTGTSIPSGSYLFGFTGDNPASLSNDGAYVAYYDAGDDLVSGQSGTASVLNVFRYDVADDSNVLVTHAAGTAAEAGDNPENQIAALGVGPAEATGPQISADGRYVAFANNSGNLISPGFGGGYDGRDQVYLYDATTGANTLVSHADGSATTPGATGGTAPAMSADGRYVSYVDWAYPASNTSAATSAEGDVRVFDSQATDATAIPPAVGTAFDPALDAAINAAVLAPSAMNSDGRVIVWDGSSTTNVGNDANGKLDVFTTDQAPPPTQLQLSTTYVPALNDTSFAQFQTTASGSGRVFQYALVPGQGSANNGQFTISQNQLVTGPNFASNTLTTYQILVRVTDANYPTSYLVQPFTLTQVVAPTGLTISQTTLPGQPGTAFATFQTTPASGRVYQYSLVSGAGSSGNTYFTVNSLTGVISTGPNYPGFGQTTYSVRVRTADAQFPGLYYELSFQLVAPAAPAAPQVPTLTLPAQLSGYQGTGFPFAIAVTDGAPAVVTLQISGVPPWVTFSAGTYLGNGTWAFTPAQLVGLTMYDPYPGSFVLSLVATAALAPGGPTSTASGSLAVQILPAVATVDVSAPASFNPTGGLTISVGSSAPGAEIVQSVTVNWGDGTVQTYAGPPGTYTHQYPVANSTYSVQVSETDQNGTFDAPAVAVAAALPTVAQGVVASLYLDLLGRSADAAGLNGWSAQLAAGAPVAQITAGIVASTEYQARELNALYEQYLGRPVDALGESSFLSLLASNGPTAVAAAILGSQEFYADAGGTPQGFLAALYAAALDRPIDAGGLAADLSALASGLSRQAVALSVLDSGESARDAVESAYETYLGRSADPASLPAWEQVYVNDPAAFLVAFLSSPELAMRAASDTTVVPTAVQSAG